jgi:hypothetical protein
MEWLSRLMIVSRNKVMKVAAMRMRGKPQMTYGDNTEMRLNGKSQAVTEMSSTMILIYDEVDGMVNTNLQRCVRNTSLGRMNLRYTCPEMVLVPKAPRQ